MPILPEPPAPAGALQRSARFIALAFAFTWLVWVAILLFHLSLTAAPGMLCVLVGGYGPTFAALVAARVDGGPGAPADLFRRRVRFRIPVIWYLAALLLVPTLSVLSILLASIFGQPPPSLHGPEQFLGNRAAVLSAVLLTLVTGPLAEELGWRGYALPELQARWGPGLASAVLGVIWAVWHLPLFWMRMPPYDTTPFPLFVLIVTSMAFPFTWIYRGSGGSVVPALVLHFMYNFVPRLIPAEGLAGQIRLALGALLALGLALAWSVRQPDLAPDP